jgi:hypothetical protein
LKTLSPQELRLVEIAAHDLQKNPDVSEHTKNKDKNKDKDKDKHSDLDFDEDGWLHPKPEHVLEFMEAWQGCLEGMTEEDFYRIKYERITGEPQ